MNNPATILSSSSRPVVLITGASRGLGAAMAERLSGQATVYRAARSVQADHHGRCLQMDVTDSESVRSAVAQVVDEVGRIDVLINNAGIVSSGPADTMPLTDVSRVMDVNFLGAIRVTQAVLPVMRRQGRGLIVSISSMAAAIPLPYRASYAASKAALEAWAWGLRLEMKSQGIGICCIQPGDCNTELSVHDLAGCASSPTSSESEITERVCERYRKDEACGLSPEQFADDVARILQRSYHRLRFRYTAGRLSQRILFACRHLLPECWQEMLINHLYLRGR